MGLELTGDVLVNEEEVTAPKVPKHGYKPTPEEVDKHNACHIPFRKYQKSILMISTLQLLLLRVGFVNF